MSAYDGQLLGPEGPSWACTTNQEGNRSVRKSKYANDRPGATTEEAIEWAMRTGTTVESTR